MTGSEPAGAPPCDPQDPGDPHGPRDGRDPGGPPEGSSAEPPGAEVAAAEVARLRLVVARLYRQLAQASPGDLDLTYAQLSALARTAAHGPVRLGELAVLEHAAASSLSRTLRPLSAAGLITKQADPADGRSYLVSVTPAGAEHLDRIRRERSELLARRMSRLTPEQNARLLAALPVLEMLLTEGDA